MDSFVIQHKIRDGYFGAEHVLEEVRWKGNKLRLVKMIVMKNEDDARCSRDVFKNTLLQLPKHDNVVRLKNVLLRRENYTELFVCPVYQKLEGKNLNDYIMSRHPALADDEYKVFFTQLMNGVAFVHTHGFSHGLLNPFNIIVTQDKAGEAVLKLTDYGLAKLYGNPDARPRPTTDTTNIKDKENVRLEEGRDLARTYFAAPETYDHDISWLRRCGTTVDMFNVGLIMYALAEHKILPNSNTLAAYVDYPGYGAISVGRFCYDNPSINFDQQFYSRCSSELRQIIRRLLHVDPNARPSAAIIIQLLQNCTSVRKVDVDTRQSRKRKRNSAMFDPLMSPPQHTCSLGGSVRRAGAYRFVRRASKRLKNASNTLQQHKSFQIPS